MAKTIGSAWCDYFVVDHDRKVIYCIAPDSHKCKVISCPVYPMKLGILKEV